MFFKRKPAKPAKCAETEHVWAEGEPVLTIRPMAEDMLVHIEAGEVFNCVRCGEVRVGEKIELTTPSPEKPEGTAIYWQ